MGYRTRRAISELKALCIKQHGIELLKIHELNLKLETIMGKQIDMAQEMAAITAQVAKIGEESKATLQKVADLEAALAAQDSVTPELQTAFDALKAQVTVVDDLIPDATPPVV
jgi:hypothetical protein